MTDPVNPPHYKNDSSGFECIELAEHFHSGLLQQAFQYVWRAGAKGDAREDLKKAMWFIGREHELRKRGQRQVLTRSDLADGIFLEWRVKVDSNLRAAILANLWRIDGDDRVHLTEFYTLCELVESWRGTFG